MQNETNLYFIALIPQQKLLEEVIDIKRDMLRFNAEKALKVMPHITLKAPFQLEVREHIHLLSWFQNLFILNDPFYIQLKNFGCFPNPVSPVIYINPVLNTSVYALQKEIIRSFKNSFPGNVHKVDLNFKPHMTIAYRDLSPEMFDIAWEEYKSKKFEAIFQVESFYLLQHDRKKWNIIDIHSLATATKSN